MSKLIKGDFNKKNSAEYENSAEAPTTNIGGLQPHLNNEDNSDYVEKSTGKGSLAYSLYGSSKHIKKEDLLNDLKDYISNLDNMNKNKKKSSVESGLFLKNGYKLDWLAFTFSRNIDLNLVLKDLGYSIDEFLETNGRYFYNSGLSLGGYVNIYYNAFDKEIFKNSSNTVNIVFTGQGCTDLWNRSGKSRSGFLETLKSLKKYKINCTRLDVAFDDFTGVFDFNLMERKLKDSEYRSCKRTYNVVKSSDVNKLDLGHTIYIGSTRSSSQKGNFYLRFYDKKAQYIEKNQILPPIVEKTGIWKRAEISFTKKKSNQVFYELVNSIHDEDYIFKTNLRNLIEFLEPTKEQKKAKRHHRERWSVCSWWEKFLSYENKYSFESHERDVDLSALLNWIKVSVLPSLKILEILGHYKNFDIYEILRFSEVDVDSFSKKQKRLLYNAISSDEEDIKSFMYELFFGGDYYV